MRCDEVISCLEKLAPPSFAESWDNPGLLTGREDKEITNVMIALDATDGVIEQAVAAGVSMLLTHHPLVFSPVKRIRTSDFTGRRLYRLIQRDICCYAMHTNFDVACMADAAAGRLGLSECRVLEVTCRTGEEEKGIGCYGKLPQRMSLKECACYVKEIFHLESVKVFGEDGAAVSSAAVCPGAGKSVIGLAAGAGAEVFITGDIDHHSGLDCLAQGMNVIDAGHFGLEKIFMPYMEAFLKQELPELLVSTAKEKAPFWVL